jgi:alanine racemase
VALALARAEARIDLARLRRNYSNIAAAAARPVMPVVKADAYGHGAARIAREFEALGAPMLAVAYPEEGASLRQAGVRIPILVIAGCRPGEGALFIACDLTPAVSSPATLDGVVLAARLKPGLAVHLKVDTGMSRLGFPAEAAMHVADRLAEEGALLDGVMTHLGSADEDALATAAQLDRFDRVVSDLAGRGHRPRWVHAANSAGLACLRPSHTLVRPGLLLYGLHPRPHGPAIEVEPVMTLATRVAVVRDVAAGTPVSYGGRWVAERASRIAALSIGYADGVPRTDLMAETGYVTIRGQRARLAGPVCMDFFMADVTELTDAGAGDEAIVFGDAPSAWDLAWRAGTNAWQILTGIGARVPRVYSGGAAS